MEIDKKCPTRPGGSGAKTLSNVHASYNAYPIIPVNHDNGPRAGLCRHLPISEGLTRIRFALIDTMFNLSVYSK